MYFRFDTGERRLTRRYIAPNGAYRTMQQYRHYRRNFPEAVLLFQVGRFFEFYARRDEPVACALALKPMRKAGRGARYGFPAGALRLYLPRLLECGRSAVVIAERDEYLTAIKTRLPASRYEPLAGEKLRCGQA